MKILSKKVFSFEGKIYNIDTLSDLQVKKLTGKSKEDLFNPEIENITEKKSKVQLLAKPKNTQKNKEKI